jgi:metal-responsive CopG/Arc/MetJ family transcriptional regulator
MGQRTSPLLTFVVDKELIDRLDDFRFAHRFRSRAETVRWLLEWALDENPTPEK